MCNMERIGHTASEDMSSENVDRRTPDDMDRHYKSLIMTYFQMNAHFSFAFCAKFVLSMMR